MLEPAAYEHITKNASDSVVELLLQSKDPSIRYFTLTDILDKPKNSPEVEKAWRLIPSGPRVLILLDGQQSDGSFGVHPYQKWTGAHWRLVSLVELGITSGSGAAVRATNLVLEWLLGEAHLRNVPKINGRYRRCASQEGNALAVCSQLGLAEDPRVVKLAQSLVSWQWADGGWNCDRDPEADHSSVNESLSTLWGLVEYQHATGDRDFLKPIESVGILSTTSSLPFRPHWRNNSFGHGQAALPVVLALRYSPRAHYTLESEKATRPADQGSARHC